MTNYVAIKDSEGNDIITASELKQAVENYQNEIFDFPVLYIGISNGAIYEVAQVNLNRNAIVGYDWMPCGTPG